MNGKWRNCLPVVTALNSQTVDYLLRVCFKMCFMLDNCTVGNTSVIS